MTITRTVPVEQAALTLEIDGDGVAWLIFDRPESRVNILTSGVMARLDLLLADIEEAARTGRVRAVVVRSGKPGTFIAGANIDEIAEITDPREAEAKAREGQRIFRRLERLPVPSVVAIDGICLGGGTELALACGARLASDSPATRIGLPEVRLGIIPGFGGTQRLPRLVGLGAAMRLVLTGELIDAEEAARIGLVDLVVDDAELTERTHELARTIASHSPVALRLAKDALRASLETPLNAGLRHERELFVTAFASEDGREGVRAFVEKRAPRFSGR